LQSTDEKEATEATPSTTEAPKKKGKFVHGEFLLGKHEPLFSIKKSFYGIPMPVL
jgi:hypothetical protein